MKTYLALLASIILCVSSCNSQEQTVTSIQIKQSSVNIPLDSLGLATYAAEPHIFHKGQEDFLYTYNRPNSSIDVFNLTEKKFLNRIPISREGPDQINKVYHMLVKSPDSLYIMGGRILYLLNAQGKVMQKHNMSFTKPDYEHEGYFHAPNDTYIDIKENIVRGFFSRPNPNGLIALSKPFLAQYNLNSGELTFSRAYYPDFIKNTEEVYPSIKPNLSFIGNKVYFNFNMASTLYAYDFKTHKTAKFEAKSQFSQNMSKGKKLLDPGHDYYNENTIFKKLQQYPGKPYFYRIHWGDQPAKTPEGELTDASTKPGFLMVFDEELNILSEIKLDQNCHVDGNFATKEGIFFWAKDGENEDEIKLCRYTIQE